MKTPKLLFAVAIAFAAISFSSKAKADGLVTLEFHDNVDDPTPIYGWGVTMWDVNNAESYYFDSYGTYDSWSNSYHMGYVPNGDYTTTIEFYSDYWGDITIDWTANTTNDSMYEWNHDLSYFDDYTLASSANTSGVMHVDDLGEYINITRYN